MTRKQLVAAAAAVTVVLAGCSKSEDVPAGRRLFGDPPRIELVSITPPSQQIASATYDVSDYLRGFLCYGGIPPDVEFTPGPAVVTVHYTLATIEVTVGDPQGVENVLFVGASYIKPDTGEVKEESTLVLFDDGSENRFPQAQIDSNFGGQDCTFDLSVNSCSCQGKEFKVTSNDGTKADGKFTRAIAFVPQGAPLIAQDCIMENHEQVPIQGGSGDDTISFRIDAVDREGNLDTADTQPSVTIGPFNPTTDFSCTGDECACCIFLHPNNYNDGTCHGKPGLNSPALGGAGICETLI